MISQERRTKIVCTIGPSTNSREKIEELVKNGMNVARLNFSHGTHEDHARNIEYIRSVAKQYQESIAVLMDLQGPKIRVGQMEGGGQMLAKGAEVQLTPEDVVGNNKRIPIDYEFLAEDARVGDRILLDDGLLEFRITGNDGKIITAEVVVGGFLKQRKGVNLPGVKLSIPSLTEKDIEDLHFGIEQGADIVAISFVRSANDIQELISIIRSKNSNAAVVAKIEKPEAVENIDDIIEETDGIMVARGDLGIEIPSEKVPLVQKKIIEKCRSAGKPVITATQMLESMINNARPTRAESSDVANAVLDGTDAVMLSGETAAGAYPIKAVQAMHNICCSVEQGAEYIYNSLKYRKPEWKEKQVVESISYSCVRIAADVDAKAIATITHSGNTARRIAKFRPGVPIFAFTESQKVRRQLNLVWGVKPVRLDKVFDTDQSVQLMEDYLRDNGMVGSGDRIIIATGIPLSKRGRTNMVKVSTID